MPRADAILGRASEHPRREIHAKLTSVGDVGVEG
jgi:hypothetical protein